MCDDASNAEINCPTSRFHIDILRQDLAKSNAFQRCIHQTVESPRRLVEGARRSTEINLFLEDLLSIKRKLR
jgi:hypothetical protein